MCSISLVLLELSQKILPKILPESCRKSAKDAIWRKGDKGRADAPENNFTENVQLTVSLFIANLCTHLFRSITYKRFGNNKDVYPDLWIVHLN